MKRSWWSILLSKRRNDCTKGSIVIYLRDGGGAASGIPYNSRESPYFDQGSGYFSNPPVRGLGSFLKRFPKNCNKRNFYF